MKLRYVFVRATKNFRLYEADPTTTPPGVIPGKMYMPLTDTATSFTLETTELDGQPVSH